MPFLLPNQQRQSTEGIWFLNLLPRSVAGNRELPPRFQRKQQMQQKDAHFAAVEAGLSDAASSYGVIPSSSGSGATSVSMHGVLFQQPPGTYAPMMPPMMMGTSVMPGNPGGGSPPVTAGKSSSPAGNATTATR